MERNIISEWLKEELVNILKLSKEDAESIALY